MTPASQLAVRVALIIAALIASSLSTQALAAARCTNATGAVVAYAQTAIECPAGTQFKGEVGSVNAPSAAEQQQTKNLTSQNKLTGDALERQRIKDERAQSKAMLALQKRQAGKGKSCKTAELALARAQEQYDNAPVAKAKKSKSKSKNTTHTSERYEESKESKAQKKSKRKLEIAQDKRAMACA